MKTKSILAAILLACALTLAAPNRAEAHEYDRDDSDMWLRYVAYVAHPIGIAAEYAILRPIHWVVSRPNLDIVFGHRVTEDISYNYFEWQ